MAAVYVDTSALGRALLGEPETEAIRRLLSNCRPRARRELTLQRKPPDALTRGMDVRRPDTRAFSQRADLLRGSRLVASRLSTREWTRVNVTPMNAEELGRYVRERSRPGDPLAGQPLSRHSVNLVAQDLNSLALAAQSLRTLAATRSVPYLTMEADVVFARIKESAARYGVSIPR